MATIPLGVDGPTFIQVTGGKVHVLPPREPEQAATLVRFGDISDDLALSLALGHVVTRCGRTIAQHRGGMCESAQYVNEFEDDHLCRRCYLTVPEDEQGQLFEHAQSASDE